MHRWEVLAVRAVFTAGAIFVMGLGIGEKDSTTVGIALVALILIGMWHTLERGDG